MNAEKIFDISLYGILDSQVAFGRALADMARVAADYGATMLQYRAKDTDTRQMVAEARAIRAALIGTGVPLIINDRVDVALAANAQGVHLGREDMRPDDARALLGPKAIIGATVKSGIDLIALVGHPIDYACIGGVFTTSHKENPEPPVGLAGFASLRAQARAMLGNLPVGAIAGITLGNAGEVIAAGADGIAVIGAMFDGDAIGAQTEALARMVTAAKRGEGR